VALTTRSIAPRSGESFCYAADFDFQHTSWEASDITHQFSSYRKGGGRRPTLSCRLREIDGPAADSAMSAMAIWVEYVMTGASEKNI